MKNRYTLLLAVLLLSFVGCKKNNDDPEPPTIEFVGFNYLEKDANGRDLQVEMIIHFKDKNGDIGHIDEEKTDACGRPVNDLFLYYERYENGIYIPHIIPHKDTLLDASCNIISIKDSAQYEQNRILRYIQPEGNNKAIEGEISYLMRYQDVFSTLPPAPVSGQLLPAQGRFRIYIKDRAGNKSNEVYSQALIVNR
ncbi:MAG: hypothetical protein ABI772_01490 [Bacteroidota bacterium]